MFSFHKCAFCSNNRCIRFMITYGQQFCLWMVVFIHHFRKDIVVFISLCFLIYLIYLRMTRLRVYSSVYSSVYSGRHSIGSATIEKLFVFTYIRKRMLPSFHYSTMCKIDRKQELSCHRGDNSLFKQRINSQLISGQVETKGSDCDCKSCSTGVSLFLCGTSSDERNSFMLTCERFSLIFITSCGNTFNTAQPEKAQPFCWSYPCAKKRVMLQTNKIHNLELSWLNLQRV